MKQKKTSLFFIPVIVSILFAAGIYLELFEEADYFIYDTLLLVRPKLEQDNSIVFLEVDDTAIDFVGVWPWSRHIMADGLFLLKEMGARQTVFDIEYTQASPRGINHEILSNDIPRKLQQEFETINANTKDLVTAIAGGFIPAQEAGDYVTQVEDLNFAIKDDIEKEIQSIARNNDTYLGDSALFFENAYFTVTMIPDVNMKLDENYKDWVLKNISYENISGDMGTVREWPDIVPAIEPVLSSAKGAGFPNIIIDSDGVRRRIYLFSRYGEYVFPQLVISPLLDMLGDPEVHFEKHRITIDTGKDSEPINIPVNKDGTVAINWTGTEFADSFRHLSYYHLVLHQNQEQELIHNLQIMDESEYFSYYDGEALPLDIWAYLQQYKKDVISGVQEFDEEFIQGKDYFYEIVGDFLSGETEQTIMSIIDDILASPDFTEEERNEYLAVKTEVETNFGILSDLYEDLMKTRALIRNVVDDSFIIVGATATSTTDIGVNPFEEDFPNVGTHGAVLNMILQNQFIQEYSAWYAFAAAAVLLLILALLLPRLNPIPGVIIGVVCNLLLLSGISAVFLLLDIYLPSVGALLLLVSGFVALFLSKLIITGKEKAFIHRAFNHYLSVDVINEILKDPDKLALGGEKKYISAMFTDVRGFSTISEKMDPSDLVLLLNTYLSEMSDIILDVQGTIDKYEGDAIISFFGAPVAMPDHARRACLAAVRMAEVETQLNKQFLDNGMLNTPLYTRIGINTGDMVVGNMGTSTRMDYTIMGNSVNLAARLEGVNKQYDSRILISEMTRGELDDLFVLRRLDKVRVVGIKTPVRLFEVLAESKEAEDKMLDLVVEFQKGLDIFEEKRWKEAAKCFSKCLEIMPEDGPSAIYLRRCREYIKTPPPDSWDGVFNLSVK